MGMSQNRNSSSSESLCRLICMTVLKSIANQTRETKAGRSARLLNLGFPRGAFEAPLFLCSSVLLVITGSSIRSALTHLGIDDILNLCEYSQLFHDWNVTVFKYFQNRIYNFVRCFLVHFFTLTNEIKFSNVI